MLKRNLRNPMLAHQILPKYKYYFVLIFIKVLYRRRLVPIPTKIEHENDKKKKDFRSENRFLNILDARIAKFNEDKKALEKTHLELQNYGLN